MSKYLSITTLKVNGLNDIIKIHGVAEWIKKKRHTCMLPSRDPPQKKDLHRLKVKGWK